MLLVDTSVWVSHFREGNVGLASSLNDGDVVCHPFIIGELACGHLRNRSEILSLFQTLPMVIQAEHEEVLPFIENNKLMGKGIRIYRHPSARFGCLGTNTYLDA